MRKYHICSCRALSPQEYVEKVTGKCFVVSADTIGALIDEIQNRLASEGYDDLWDYPLEEIDEVIENDLSVVLVELVGKDVDGSWATILRWFEMPKSCELA